MTIRGLHDLAALVEGEREILQSRWREAVRRLPSAQELDTPKLNDHIPGVLDELVAALQAPPLDAGISAYSGGSSPIHGQQRFEEGFDIVEVVSEYSILRSCIHDLAEENGLRLSGQAFHFVNAVLDAAIGAAVQTFAAQQALEVQRHREEHLAFIGHDLRTPLNAISLAARLIELSTSTPGAGDAQALKTLRRNVRHLEELVEQILEETDDIRSEGAGLRLERRRFDLWPLVEDLIHDLEPDARGGGTEVVNRIPGDLRAYADAGLIRRVFQNLIANAIRFTPGGEVSIGARETVPDGSVECWVSDQGAGIPADRLASLLEGREHEAGEAPATQGLGLPIVKTFVEVHGGEVTAESQEGAGTTLRFTLPGPASDG